MRTLRRAHPSLIALLVLSLCLRGLIPAGFMPGDGEWLELCTAQGMQTLWFDPAADASADLDHEEAADCPWAGVINPAIAGDWSGLASLVPSATSTSQGVDYPDPRSPLIGRPPVRAPPVS